MKKSLKLLALLLALALTACSNGAGSAGKTGKLAADGEAVIVEDGGTYIPLSD